MSYITDTMPVLESTKDEQFVIALIKHKGNATKAYLEIHPEVKRSSASALASVKLSDTLIKSRLSEILTRQQLGIIATNDTLRKVLKAKKHIQIDDDKELKEVDDYAVQLEGAKVVYKLHQLAGFNGSASIPISIDQSQHLTIETGTDTEALSDIVSRLEHLKDRANDTRVAPVIDVRSIEIEPEPSDKPTPSPTQPSTPPSLSSSGTVT